MALSIIDIVCGRRGRSAIKDCKEWFFALQDCLVDPIHDLADFLS